MLHPTERCRQLGASGLSCKYGRRQQFGAAPAQQIAPLPLAYARSNTLEPQAHHMGASHLPKLQGTHAHASSKTKSYSNYQNMTNKTSQYRLFSCSRFARVQERLIGTHGQKVSLPVAIATGKPRRRIHNWAGLAVREPFERGTGSRQRNMNFTARTAVPYNCLWYVRRPLAITF